MGFLPCCGYVGSTVRLPFLDPTKHDSNFISYDDNRHVKCASCNRELFNFPLFFNNLIQRINARKVLRFKRVLICISSTTKQWHENSFCLSRLKKGSINDNPNIICCVPMIKLFKVSFRDTLFVNFVFTVCLINQASFQSWEVFRIASKENGSGNVQKIL